MANLLDFCGIPGLVGKIKCKVWMLISWSEVRDLKKRKSSDRWELSILSISLLESTTATNQKSILGCNLLRGRIQPNYRIGSRLPIVTKFQQDTLVDFIS